MAEKETDVIEHLLGLEHEAASLLLEAQTAADKRLIESRTKAEELYKKQHSELISSAEQVLKEECDKITKKHNEDFVSYQNKISASEKDISAFNALLDKLFFAE